MSCLRPVNQEAYMTTVEIIEKRGYPVEVHRVTTADGYILELHRIPRGKGRSAPITRETGSLARRPVFLQHGFVATDHVWLLTPSTQALAYVLADNGYDVWLGNSRGNPYSRQHVKHDGLSKAFWDFSYDEIGKYDVPACIEYVLKQTGSDTMSYIGHSMGCGILYMAMHHRPELNSRIDAMISLAPAASFGRTKLSMRHYAKMTHSLFAMCKAFGNYTYEANGSALHKLQRAFSGPNFIWRRPVGAIRAYSLGGEEQRHVDKDVLAVLDRHHPAGASLRQAEQLSQHFYAGQTFQSFDYGSRKNEKVYGQATPPVYDLKKVTCPVYIFWAQNDRCCTPEDVAWLASKLGNVKCCVPVDDPTWGHCAFVFARDAKRLVYDHIVDILPAPEVKTS